MNLNWMLLLFSWSDYFADSPMSAIKAGRIIKKQISPDFFVSNSKCYIFKCFFNEFSSQSDGGALSTTNSLILLVESSTFSKVTANGKKGGAIYFYNKNYGQCVISKVCSSSCNCVLNGIGTFSSGQFCNINICAGNTSKNYFTDSSAVESVVKTNIEVANREVSLNYGNVVVERNNISDNILTHFASLRIYYPDLCKISLSSFANNTAQKNNSIYIEMISGECNMEFCNVIENIVSIDGVIYSENNINIKECCFLHNKATELVTGSLNVNYIGCTMDKSVNYNTNKISSQRPSFLNPLFFGKCNYDVLKFDRKVIVHTCNAKKIYKRYERFQNVLNAIN